MNTPTSPAPADGTDAAALLGAVRDLRDAVADTDVPTDSAAAADARAVVNQFDDYILPRLSNLDAPLLAVIGGSTGSGKSTLVNGVLQEHVSNPGVIRPTTRQPILVANPANADWFNSPEVLPGLARSHGAGDEQSTTLRIVRTEQIPEGLALVDAPDFDSIDDHNRALASQLLAAADLWIFVTTPARYADQLVWNFLNDAAGRGIEVVVVLNRLDESSAETVPADLRRMMDQAGLTGATVFTVPFVTGTDEFLPNEVVAPLRDYLSTLANDTAARRDVAGKTVAGALAGALGRVDKLTAAREQQEAFANQLDQAISEQYRAASQHVIEATSDGKLLRTEVMDRWQDVVGTSDVFRGVERWFSQAVDKVGSFFTGQPAPLREVETEIETGLHAVLIDAAETAAARSWSHVGTVAPELRAQADSSLARASATVSDDAARLVRDWQQAMLERIQDTAGQKRQRARAMSLGLNVLTVALMLVVFASTAGLTGGEVAIAGGSAVVGQKMLEAIFGEDTVRRMAAEAKADLNERLEALMEAERNRYRDVTAPLHRGATADQLREAAGQARAQASARFPEALPAPANLPAVAGGEGGVDKQQSSGEADSKLRGLLDQLRGTFTRPDGQDGGTDGAV
ncbi:GTPase domain-containing protein [Corynebacterium sp. Marseille-P8863]|uniref:GTPase domain-containing protein n=1 Tax=Corynebacterium sp. Marseille-P8863 TaxID=2866576 RepID=UPI0022649AFF|nr:GTPase domain-containing protein [Corynebacterium sp. Marseille-P8863]